LDGYRHRCCHEFAWPRWASYKSGAVGGLLAQHAGAGGVFAFGAVVAVLWLLIAASMRPPVVSRVLAMPGRSLNS